MAEEEDVYECITCGAGISKEEYERNEGQCDNCVAEDNLVSTGYI